MQKTQNKIFKLLPITIAVLSSFNSFAEESISSEVNKVEVEQITVTGSRIKSANTYSSRPVTTISEEMFAQSGGLVVSEVLNELPQFGDSLSGGSSINSLNNGVGVGAQTINLRNLGANRTLVLVNGRRHVGGDIGTSAVDLNSIPSGMIANIEVLTGAASATYGADAVTGVVNIILREDYEGTDLQFRTGTSSENDADEVALNLTHGGVFDKGDYLIGLEYSSQDPIFGSSREFSQFDGSATTGLSEEVNGSGVNSGGLFSSSLGGTGGFNEAGNFVQPFSERFQRVPFRSLQNETERFVISGRVNVDLTNDITGFVETTYSRSIIDIQFESQLAIFSDAGFASSGTAGFRFPGAAPVTTNTAGEELTASTRRLTEFGPRETEIERNLSRFLVGLDGELGDSSWSMYYQYGKVDVDQTDFDTIDKQRLVTAIDPVACSAISECQFVDIYGRGTIDPTSEAWVSDDLLSKSEATQHVFSAYLSGPLLELNDSDISYVIGVEYRDESADINPNTGLIAIQDTVTNSGNLVGLKGTRTFFGSTSGSYNVSEVFGELSYNVTEDLDLGFSSRLSHYDTVGNEFTYGVTANFALTDNLRTRASFGTATRAPNIGELYAPDSVSTAAISDPCDTLDDAGNSLVPDANCIGLVSDNFNPTDLDQQIRGINGGNSDLDSETADTLSLGVVWTASTDTTISLDYFNIEMENVLADAFSTQATLDRCIATGESAFCDNITRDSSTGFVTSIRSEQINLAEESIAGLELLFAHSWDISDAKLSLNGVYSHLLEHDRKVNDTLEVEDLVGRVDNIEDRLNLTLDYQTDNWVVGTTLRYLSDAKQSMNADPSVAIGNDIPSITYLDFFSTYNITDKLSLGFGVKNLTDKESPVVTNLYENNGSADTTVAGIYDVRGRFMYLTLNYSL